MAAEVPARAAESSEPVPKRREAPPSHAGRWKSLAGDLLFYGFLVALVVVTVRQLTSSGAPKRIAGYSAAVVLSGSMQDVIPKDSLIITRQVDPNSLSIGDDITYLLDPTTTVTHRIVGITEDYLSTGQRAFWTQGTMNEEQDELPAPAVNVVGKVVFHSLLLGRIIQQIQRNWPLLLFFLVVASALIRFLKWLYRRPQQDDLPESSDLT